jgi:hypothetical protein
MDVAEIMRIRIFQNYRTINAMALVWAAYKRATNCAPPRISSSYFPDRNGSPVVASPRTDRTDNHNTTTHV